MNGAVEHVLELLSRHLTEFGEDFPAETCVNGYYPLTDNVEWTTSFWTGQLWLAWEMSGEATFREMAEKHVRSFGLRIAGRHDTNTHDTGFLYTLSCVAAAVDGQPRCARFFADGGRSAARTFSREGADHSGMGRSPRSRSGRSDDH